MKLKFNWIFAWWRFYRPARNRSGLLLTRHRNRILFFLAWDQEFFTDFKVRNLLNRSKKENCCNDVENIEKNIVKQRKSSKFSFLILFFIFRLFTGPEKIHHQRRIISQYPPLAQCRSPCQPITKCWYHSHLHYSATAHQRAFCRSMDQIDSMNRRVFAGLQLCSRLLQLDGSHRKISSPRYIKHIYKALRRTNQQPSLNRNDHASLSDRNTKRQVTAAKIATMERKSPN